MVTCSRPLLLPKPSQPTGASVGLASPTGWRPAWLAKAGLHQLGAEGLEIEVTEPVILDGEAFPAGRYRVEQGPELTFVTP